jgi:hypothetical protein
MIASVILEEKWRTQERMAEKAGYDLKKYLDNVERIVKKMEKEKGSGFKYAKLRPAKSNSISI